MIDTTIHSQEKKAQLLWTGFIIAFFVIQAIIWTVAITYTASDKSHAVVGNYDARALSWDEEVAMRTASANLGWNVILVVDPVSDIRNNHVITLHIKNKNGDPVSGASILMDAFHKALAGVPQQIALTETDDGVYSGSIMIRRSGQWKFDGKATKASTVFLIQEQQFLKVGS